MVEAVIVSLLAVLFAYMARLNRNDTGLKLSLFILTVFLSISYNWGSDVSSYNQIFDAINGSGGTVYDYSVGGAITEKGEYGWVILNRLCSGLGFWGLRMLLFSFEGFVIFRLIKHYVSRDYYWMAIFFFTFNNTLMVLGSSMMRQYFAMCIVALAMDFLIQTVIRNKNKKSLLFGILGYVCAVFFASFFHRSALLVSPAFLIIFLKYDFSRRGLIYFGVFVAVWFTFGYTLLLSSASKILTDFFDSYSSDYEEIKGGFGIGVIFNLLVYLLMFTRFVFFTREQKLVCTYASISVMIMPFVTVYEFISRFSLYFSLFSIVAYPIFFKSVSRNSLRLLLIPLIVLTLYGYWSFFHNPLWQRAYYYKTIFSIGGWQ